MEELAAEVGAATSAAAATSVGTLDLQAAAVVVEAADL